MKPTQRQPTPVASRLSSGKKINCPVAVAAVSMPVTTPRFSTNHRVATVAANTVAMHPDPRPTTIPQSAISCHGDDICVVPSAPNEMVRSAIATTRRRP